MYQIMNTGLGIGVTLANNHQVLLKRGWSKWHLIKITHFHTNHRSKPENSKKRSSRPPLLPAPRSGSDWGSGAPNARRPTPTGFTPGFLQNLRIRIIPFLAVRLLLHTVHCITQLNSRFIFQPYHLNRLQRRFSNFWAYSRCHIRLQIPNIKHND